MGNRVRFWQDGWSGDQPLQLAFLGCTVLLLTRWPLLNFSLTRIGVGERRSWDVHFIRDFNDWEMVEGVNFLHILGANIPLMDVGDQMRWKLKPNGDFDIWSFYNKLRGSLFVAFPWKGIWRVKILMQTHQCCTQRRYNSMSGQFGGKVESLTVALHQRSGEESSSGEKSTQVVVFEDQAGKSFSSTMGGVERREHGINGENKIEAKFLEGNRVRFPLSFNLNSKDVDTGKEREIRSWLGKDVSVMNSTMQPTSSVVSPPPAGRLEVSLMVPLVMKSALLVLEVPGSSDYSGQLIPSWLTKTSTVLILPMEVAKASFKQISAMVLSQASSNPMVAAVVTSSSQVVSNDGGEEIVGSEVMVNVPESSNLDIEGVHHSYPAIRELVEDLDKSWESDSDCSVMEGQAVIGNNSVVNEGHMVSWADECNGLVDSLSVVTGSEDEMWEFDERSMTWERGGEPLVLVPLAVIVPLEMEYSSVKELGCKENVDSNQLSQWVINRIKALRKSAGTSLEGFEEQIMRLFLALEAMKKNKQQHVVGDQAKLVKLAQKGGFGKGILYLRLLFDIVIEALSRMLDVAAIDVQFSSFSVGNTAGTLLKVSHLLFLDDTLIYCDADPTQIASLRAILARFEELLALIINLGKFELVPVGVVHSLDVLVELLACRQSSLPLKYLGLPLASKFKELSISNPILEKMERRLAGLLEASKE
uniref:Uncharacterized protein n=1 Tax=Quercus lobata TaxID=97700 RepID=A0A7N2L369_QUELO